jgi:hypothetical protein
MHLKVSISTLLNVNAHQALYHQLSAILWCTGLGLRVLRVRVLLVQRRASAKETKDRPGP